MGVVVGDVSLRVPPPQDLLVIGNRAESGCCSCSGMSVADVETLVARVTIHTQNYSSVLAQDAPELNLQKSIFPFPCRAFNIHT